MNACGPIFTSLRANISACRAVAEAGVRPMAAYTTLIAAVYARVQDEANMDSVTTGLIGAALVQVRGCGEGRLLGRLTQRHREIEPGEGRRHGGADGGAPHTHA